MSVLGGLMQRFGGARASRELAPVPPAKPAVMRYMAHDRSGHLAMRRAFPRDLKVDVRESYVRSFALAFDFMQNSGWIAGAASQIIADVIGEELKLNCRPDLSRLGYSPAERTAWCRLVHDEWRRYAWNKRECDLAGKATVAEMLDGAMRYYLASGEAFGVVDFMPAADRARYGLSWGAKTTLVSPYRCPHHTNPFEGWDGGICHDALGRPTHYRFRKADSGIERDVDEPARDGHLDKVIHVMDRGETPNSPRGISPMTPAFGVIAASDTLANATLTTFLLQTAFAATVTSPDASKDVFEALETLDGLEMAGVDAGEVQALAGDLLDVWQQRIDALKAKGLSIGGDASRVNHLGPGEKLEFHGAATPGPEYLPFRKDQLREICRCLGVTFESFTMDHSAATYSSVRMSFSSIWPITLRRRARIAAPFVQAIYEHFLDEGIGSGRIPFKGGYRAFRANFEKVVDTEWRGPRPPTADPYKDALADKVGLETGTRSLQRIYAERGLDWEEELDQIAREAERVGAFMAAPHGRSRGGDGAGPLGAGPLGAAAEGNREPADA